VPRQGSGRPSRQDQADYEDTQSTRRSPATPRYRPQQPPYRNTQREQAEPYDYLDGDYDDDRVISNDRAYQQPARRAAEQPTRRTRPASSRTADDLYTDEYADTGYADEYDDAGYDDSFIDEDDWYEEEAAAGAYRPRQRADRRRTPAIPRPSISISRPVMPARVKEAALVQDRGAMLLLGVLALSAIAMALVTMNRVDSLTPGFATHITASGLREDIRSQTALWQLPLMAAALLVMNLVAAWFLSAYSAFTARFLLISSIVVQALIWVALIRIAF
jgi:hypothetical protein